MSFSTTKYTPFLLVCRGIYRDWKAYVGNITKNSVQTNTWTQRAFCLPRFVINRIRCTVVRIKILV